MAKRDSIEKIRRMVTRYAEKGPYFLHPEKERVEAIIKGLANNLDLYGRAYCPCVPIEKCLEGGRKYVCPCEFHHDDIARQGYCECALFVSQEFLEENVQTKRKEG